MRMIFITALWLYSAVSFAQTAERVIVSREDPYDLNWDSNTLFYEKLIPENKPIGVLVILSGSGESIEDVRKQITLEDLALKKDLMVIFPSINWGTSKLIAEQKFLDVIFKQIIEQYHIPKDKFVIGGFSGGGMVALSYAEKANMGKDSTVVVPKAIFGVDPPVDYAHLWNHAVHDIERNFSKPAVDESNWILQLYAKEFGGSPSQYPKNYVRYSIYSYDEKDGGNAKYLKNTPVLLYTEPDVIWQMQNRQRDFYDLNCVDISAMINMLQIQGNKNARLEITANKGVRLDGTRHPHSWSIMDSDQCLQWILQQLSN